MNGDRLLKVIVLSMVLSWVPMTSAMSLDGSSERYGAGMDIPATRSDGPIWMMSGTEDIYVASTSIVLGESAEGAGYLLGELLWKGDIDGDGIADIGMTAPEAPGRDGAQVAGKIYFFKGEQVFGQDTIDLDDAQPLLTIKGGHQDSKMLTSFDTGDIDNDGNMDLILGIPSQPECGRTYVLWGSGPWTGVVELADPGRLSPNGDPYGFLRTSEYMIVAGHLAPVPWPDSDYKIGDSVVCKDLDLDGYDDVIFSAPGSNHVNVMWGGSDRMTIGDEMTTIMDSEQSGIFGDRIISADMNGNGLADLIITAPLRQDRSRSLWQVGYTMVVFDAGRIRGNGTLSIEEVARPMISGTDANDKFGTTLIAEDIDLDGDDDLLVGCPGSDGPSDNLQDSGSIHLFKGGPLNQFPTYMDAESGSDMLIYGEYGDRKGNDGDGVGTAFDIGDVDGDGDHDLVVAIKNRGNGVDEGSGSVLCFSGKTVLNSGKSIVTLKTDTARFEVLGRDQEDKIGFDVKVADLDDDGSDDVYLSSTTADGPDNLRPNSGEVYILKGVSASIEEVKFSGTGTYGGIVTCGRGVADLYVNFSHSIGTDLIDSVKVTFPGTDIVIRADNSDGAAVMISSGFDEVVPAGNIDLNVNGKMASMLIPLFIDWSFPQDITDVDVEISSGDETYIRHSYDVIEIVKDVKVSEDVSFMRNGRAITHPNAWFAKGETLSIGGLRLLYDMEKDLPLDSSPFITTVYLDGSPLKTSDGPAISDVSVILDNDGISLLEIGLELNETKFDTNLPLHLMPNIPPKVTYSIRVDGDEPFRPVGIELIPDEEGDNSYFDDDDQWSAEWTSGFLDGDEGSGVWGYEYSQNGMDFMIAEEKGGLMGTFFNDDSFEGPVDIVTHPGLEFNWGKFPPKDSVVPNGYSVRWHGWLLSPEYGTTRFTVFGTGGMSKLIIDGVTIMDWRPLNVRFVSDLMEFEQDGKAYVEFYFTQEGDEGVFINLKWDDESGDTTTIPQENLFHPSTSADIINDGGDEVSVYVRAIDWVDLRSDTGTSVGRIDRKGPHFDLEGYRSWHNDTRIDLTFGVYDPDFREGNGSGVNISSISYRMKKLGDTEMSEPISSGIWTEPATDPGKFDVRVRLQTEPSWQGNIEFMARDMVGNSETTPSLFLGVDQLPPDIEILLPPSGMVHNSNDVSFFIRADDNAGSGVEARTAKYRTRTNTTEWSSWNDIGKDAITDEITFEFVLELPEGSSRIQFQIMDAVGNQRTSEDFEVRVSLPPIDMVPTAVISNPLNGSRFTEGFRINLDASGSSDDGVGKFGELRYSWFSNRTGILGEGKILGLNLRVIGWHRITLYVDDGSPGHNVSTFIDVEIVRIDNPDKPSNDSDNDDKETILKVILPLAVLALIIIAIVALLIVNYRKKKDQELQIEYKEESMDDLEYSRKSSEEFDALGYDMESGHRYSNDIYERDEE